MLTAIRQPLFIQTPLQVMLETMVDKLQLQAGVISTLQDRVGVLERNKLTGSELLSRIQLLESRMDAAAALTGMAGDTGSAAAGANNGSSGSGGGSGCGAGSSSSSVGVSPFAQAKLMKQLQDVEQQVSGLLANSAQLGFRTEQVLLPRLQQAEQRLAGVSNLAGTCMAVDLIAAELGIAVPHPPLSALTTGLDGHLGGHDPTQQPQQQSSMPSSQTATPRQHHQQVPQQQQPHPTGVLTVSRQQQIQQQLDGHKQQLDAVQQQVQQLQQQVSQLACDSSALQDQQLGVLAGLQDSLSGLSDRLTKEAALLRREFKPALQATELQRLSLAEFSKLQGQVQTWGDKSTALSKELEAHKVKDFAELSTSVAQLSRRVARIVGAPGALSETERALAAAQAELRGQMDALSSRLAAHEAAEMASRAVAAAQHAQQEQSGRTPGKASQVDMRDAVAAAVAAVLQTHQELLGEVGRAAASRSRCLVCDRALRDGSPHRCSTAPQQQQQQDSELLLPFMDAFMPATAAAAAATAAAAAGGRFYDGGSNGGAAAAGSSSRPGSPSRLAGSAGSLTGPMGPMGPGLQAAQHRQQSAHKAGKLPPGGTGSSSSSPSRPSSHRAAAGAGAGAGGSAHGILGLMPVGGSKGIGPALSAGPDGLFIADLVGSTLHISAAPTASHAGQAHASLAERADSSDGHEPAVSCASSNRPAAEPQQQQQQSPVAAVGKAAGLRPQTAASAGSRSAVIAAVRPLTAVPAAAAGPGGRPSSSSPLGPGAKRTPVFI